MWWTLLLLTAVVSAQNDESPLPVGKYQNTIGRVLVITLAVEALKLS